MDNQEKGHFVSLEIDSKKLLATDRQNYCLKDGTRYTPVEYQIEKQYCFSTLEIFYGSLKIDCDAIRSKLDVVDADKKITNKVHFNNETFLEHLDAVPILFLISNHTDVSLQNNN